MEMSQVRSAFWTKDFIVIALSNLFLFVSFQMLIPTLPAYVGQNGGDQVGIRLVISLFTASALLVRPYAGKTLDTMGRRNVLILGLAIFLLSVMGYYWYNVPFSLIGQFFLYCKV